MIYKEFFDTEHYRKVRQARRAKSLPLCSLNIKLNKHNLLRKIIVYKNTKYTIVSVYKHWLAGWYLVLTIENEKGNSKIVFWENINSIDNTILEKIDINKKTYRIL